MNKRFYLLLYVRRVLVVLFLFSSGIAVTQPQPDSPLDLVHRIVTAEQNLVRDFVNGFFILVENQYAVGDWVKIGAHEGAADALRAVHH